MKIINYNEIQKEIYENHKDLKNGNLDVYDFTAKISEEYFKPVDEEWATRTKENPYLDLLFAMLEINEIELY